MEGKNTGAIMFTIYFICLCAIIGSSFMAFIYPTKKITVEDPQVVAQTGIVIKNSDGEIASTLKFNTSKLGLKPATGEEDDETEIPTTITDKSGSEGLFTAFKITSSGPWKLYVTDINIKSSGSADGERENIKVGLKDTAGSTKTLEGDRILIEEGESCEDQEYTFFVWLHAAVGDGLVGSTISFVLSFENA